MKNQNYSPSIRKEKNKLIKLNPKHADLSKPETFISHIKGLAKDESPTKHVDILEYLLEEFEEADFKTLAFPEARKLKMQIEKLESEITNPENFSQRDQKAVQDDLKDRKLQLEKYKLNNKHYLVLAIERVLKIAEKHNYCICRNYDFIYIYNGMYWSEVDKEVFQKFLGKAAEKMGIPKYSARYYHFKEQLFKQFLGTAYLPTPEIDKDIVLINLKNGTFQISNKQIELRPFAHKDFLTYQLSFNYDPEAKAPLFIKYLNRVLPDKQRQKILAEYLGSVFIRNGSDTIKEEKALILYGTGANGKSVFFEIVNALLGKKNTSTYSLQNLTDESGYYRAKIAKKLVNYASEINGKLEASIFKQLVSGEPITARLPYGQPMQLTQYAKLIFNCNELPREVEQTNAFFRRFLIIGFDETIPPEEQDKNLHFKIISKELSGVFNWVLNGLNRFLNQGGFTECKSAHEAVEQYKKESDSVKMFLNEKNYEKDACNYILLKNIYTEYKAFCIEDGFKPVNKNNFRRRLEGIGIEVKRLNIGNVVYLSEKSFE